jgi:hypothetical protein
MIVRLSKLLATKIREIELPALPPHPNPIADWSAHLFTVRRAQYILITNGATLYSAVIFRKGITTYGAFLKRMVDAIREVMAADGLSSAYENLVVPEASQISLSKAINRSLTGSMNEFIFYARMFLQEDDMSPFEISFRLNDTIMKSIKYQRPRAAFRAIVMSR